MVADLMTFPQEYFLGYWYGDGYKCNQGGVIPEDIWVHYENGKVIATKIHGDDCVTSGTKTFSFDLADNWDTNTAARNCVITLGGQYNPNSSSGSCNLVPRDQNTFDVKNWGLTFVRADKPLTIDPDAKIKPNAPVYPKNAPVPAASSPVIPIAPVDPLPIFPVTPVVPTTVISYKRDYFLGFWIGKGYTCNTGGEIAEDINITYTTTSFVATKVHGDDCVNSGQVTFTGNIKDAWIPVSGTNFNIPCTITLGSPSNPQSTKSTNCSINIIDDNTFKVNDWGLTFIRGRLPTPGLTYPVDYFKGAWTGSGYTCASTQGLLTEDVEIAYNAGEFVAVKVNGDACVQTGQMSFSAILQDQFVYCNEAKSYRIPCRIFFGTPSKPSSTFSNTCSIEILDEDTFRIPQWNLLFRRKGCWNLPEGLNKPILSY